MTITVTQSDIEQGRRQDCQSCPVARAIKRALGDAGIDVGQTAVQWSRTVDGELRLGWSELPMAAVWFIARFDQRHVGPIRPFTFELDLTVERPWVPTKANGRM